MKLSAKQIRTQETMKKNRQLDNTNLRALITSKLEWAINERKKGVSQIEILKVQITRLDGIILFIKELIEQKND